MTWRPTGPHCKEPRRRAVVAAALRRSTSVAGLAQDALQRRRPTPGPTRPWSRDCWPSWSRPDCLQPAEAGKPVAAAAAGSARAGRPLVGRGGVDDQRPAGRGDGLPLGGRDGRAPLGRNTGSTTDRHDGRRHRRHDDRHDDRDDRRHGYDGRHDDRRLGFWRPDRRLGFWRPVRRLGGWRARPAVLDGGGPSGGSGLWRSGGSGAGGRPAVRMGGGLSGGQLRWSSGGSGSGGPWRGEHRRLQGERGKAGAVAAWLHRTSETSGAKRAFARPSTGERIFRCAAPRHGMSVCWSRISRRGGGL